jgi:hypothetical protein
MPHAEWRTCPNAEWRSAVATFAFVMVGIGQSAFSIDVV